MKLMRIFASLILTMLLAAGSASAGDFAYLNFIGFSKDGRYLAFEEYGIQDGSGYPYSNIYFIDTDKNAYAAPSVRVRVEDESGAESTARKRSAGRAAANLKRFGIARGNTGRTVVSHQMTDFTYGDGSGTDTGLVARFAEEMWSMHRQGDYELELKPIKVTKKDCDYAEQDVFMLELKLTDHQDDESKFLQKDATLPADRGCAQSYRLQDVHLYKGRIAVFINVFTPGFEGPDMRFMVVTGVLKYPLPKPNK